MFKETLTERDDVIGLVCEGKLTETEFNRHSPSGLPLDFKIA